MDYKERPSDSLFRDCVPTTLTEEELAFYLRQAWKEIYNAEVTKQQLCILWCHTSLEVGRGKFIYNNNFGNIKRREGQPYTSYKCNEILNGKAHWFEPYHPQTFFQSWDSPVEGAKAYLQFLNKKRYQPALQALKEGSIEKYCAKLKEGGYFTADLNYYTNLMVKLSKSFDKKSEIFMTFIPESYKSSEEIDIDVTSFDVKEQDLKNDADANKADKNISDTAVENSQATLAPVPKTQSVEDKPQVNKDKIEAAYPQNKFKEILAQVISLIIKFFKGQK